MSDQYPMWVASLMGSVIELDDALLVFLPAGRPLLLTVFDPFGLPRRAFLAPLTAVFFLAFLLTFFFLEGGRALFVFAAVFFFPEERFVVAAIKNSPLRSVKRIYLPEVHQKDYAHCHMLIIKKQ